MKPARFIRLLPVALPLLIFAVWLFLRPPHDAPLSGYPTAGGNVTSSSATALGNTRTTAKDEGAGSSSKNPPAQSSSVTGEAAKEQLRKSGQYESLAAALHSIQPKYPNTLLDLFAL